MSIRVRAVFDEMGVGCSRRILLHSRKCIQDAERYNITSRRVYSIV